MQAEQNGQIAMNNDRSNNKLKTIRNNQVEILQQPFNRKLCASGGLFDRRFFECYFGLYTDSAHTVKSTFFDNSHC